MVDNGRIYLVANKEHTKSDDCYEMLNEKGRKNGIHILLRVIALVLYAFCFARRVNTPK